MKFDIHKATEILERTPAALRELLEGLSPAWTEADEGPDTWNPYDVIGHLVHGERTDWIPRAQIILSDREDKRFQPFNRFAQFEESKGKTIEELLEEFAMLRKQSLETLKAMNIDEEKLSRTGIHPEFGTVTLSELLSTWVTHDLGHIAQICRVMAKQYKQAAGPWVKYIGILSR